MPGQVVASTGLSIVTDRKWINHSATQGRCEKGRFEIEPVLRNPTLYSFIGLSVPVVLLTKGAKSLDIREDDPIGQKYNRLLYFMLHFIQRLRTIQTGASHYGPYLADHQKAFVFMEPLCPPGVLYDYTKKVRAVGSNGQTQEVRIPKTAEEIEQDERSGAKPSKDAQNALIAKSLLAIRFGLFYLDGTSHPDGTNFKEEDVTSILRDEFDGLSPLFSASEMTEDAKVARRITANPFAKGVGRFIDAKFPRPVEGDSKKKPTFERRIGGSSKEEDADPWVRTKTLSEMVDSLSIYSRLKSPSDENGALVHDRFLDSPTNPFNILKTMGYEPFIGSSGRRADPRQVNQYGEYMTDGSYGVFPFPQAVWMLNDIRVSDFKTRLFPWLSDLAPATKEKSIDLAQSLLLDSSPDLIVSMLEETRRMYREREPASSNLLLDSMDMQTLYGEYKNVWEPINFEEKALILSDASHERHELGLKAHYTVDLIRRMTQRTADVTRSCIPMAVAVDEDMTIPGLERKGDRLMEEVHLKCAKELKTIKDFQRQFEAEAAFMAEDTDPFSKITKLTELQSRGYKPDYQIEDEHRARLAEAKEKVGDDQLDDLQYIMDGKGTISPGFEAVRAYFMTEVLSKSNGFSPNRPRLRWLKDGSTMAEWLQFEMITNETVTGCAFVHDLMFVGQFSTLHVYTESPFHPHLIMYGPWAVGKSFVLMYMSKTMINGTFVMLSHESLRANATAVDWKDIVAGCEETPRRWIDPTLKDEKIEQLKNEMTTGISESSVIETDPKTNKRSTVRYVASVNRLWMLATNMSLNEIDRGILDRTTRWYAQKYDEEQRRVLEKTIHDLKTDNFVKLKRATVDHARWRQAVFCVICKAIKVKGIPGPCLRAAEAFVMSVLRAGEREGLQRVNDIRNYMRVRMWLFIVVIVDAMDLFYRVHPHFVGEPWKTRHLKFLTPFMVSRFEHAQFVLTLLAFQYENQLRQKIQGILFDIVNHPSFMKRDTNVYVNRDPDDPIKLTSDPNRLQIRISQLPGFSLPKSDYESDEKVITALASYIAVLKGGGFATTKEVESELRAMMETRQRCGPDEATRTEAESVLLVQLGVSQVTVARFVSSGGKPQQQQQHQQKEVEDRVVIICRPWVLDQSFRDGPGYLMRKLVQRASCNDSAPEVPEKRIIGMRPGSLRSMWDHLEVKREPTRKIKFWEGERVEKVIQDVIARGFGRIDSDDYSPECEQFDVRQLSAGSYADCKDGKTIEEFFASEYLTQTGWSDEVIQHASKNGDLAAHPLESKRREAYRLQREEAEINAAGLDVRSSEYRMIMANEPVSTFADIQASLKKSIETADSKQALLMTPVKPLRISGSSAAAAASAGARPPPPLPVAAAATSSWANFKASETGVFNRPGGASSSKKRTSEQAAGASSPMEYDDGGADDEDVKMGQSFKRMKQSIMRNLNPVQPPTESKDQKSFSGFYEREGIAAPSSAATASVLRPPSDAAMNKLNEALQRRAAERAKLSIGDLSTVTTATTISGSIGPFNGTSKQRSPDARRPTTPSGDMTDADVF